MSKIGVYAGSFDPPTNGHIDIIKRALKMFDKVVVAIAKNPEKKTEFSLEERMEMLKEITKDMKNVEIDSFDGLLIDYLAKKNANVIIRGLRAVSDFEYEFQLALMNRRLGKDVETVFLIPDENYTYLSSSIVKEIAKYGGDISTLVDSYVGEKLKEKYLNFFKKSNKK